MSSSVSNSSYFLSSPTNFINSQRDFSIGKSDRLSEKTVLNSKISVINIDVDEEDNDESNDKPE